MPKFNGKTDEVLKVQLKSALLSASWGLAAVSMGGRIPIEVETQFVADGSDIKVTIKDVEGGVLETLTGKTYSNYYRAIFPLTKPNKTGGMFFEVEISAHGLKAVGPKLRVLPPVQITEMKWADEKGAALKEISDGQIAELSAKVAGPLDGTEAYIAIKCKKEVDRESDVGTYPVKIKDGKVTVKCAVKIPGGPQDIAIQKQLEKLGLEYFQPTFLFEVGCLGTTAKSAELKSIAWVTFTFGPAAEGGGARSAVLVMPDGAEKKESIPKDGIVKIKSLSPGKIQVKDVTEE
ncbi:MAG: hypothetical protein M3Y08_15475 [Fibrobacterota bacterium]|nr:hypothetical protein [Fibrobacterota bacterium]